MSNNLILRNMVLDAFKGFLTTSILEPLLTKREKTSPKYRATGIPFSNEKNEDLELYYEEKSHKRVLDLVERYYPGQTDRNLVSRFMVEILTKWMDDNDDSIDQKDLEKAGEELFKKIEENIKKRLLFIPIDGLVVNSQHTIQVGNCELHNNSDGSDFTQVRLQSEKRYSKTPDEINESDLSEKAPSYFTYVVEAQPGRAFERAIEEGNFSLNILRLFISSFYFHRNYEQKIIWQMGLSGSLHTDESSRIFYINPDIPIEEQYPGTQRSRVIQKSFEITTEHMDNMKENGLDWLNYLIQLENHSEEEEEIFRRMVRAVNWFSKATNAKSAADSFLMYAIAIEGLLSEGRTPQETYSTQMSALITCDKEDCLMYPVAGYVSSDFGKQLGEAKDLNEKFNISRNRIMELFSYRNQIAHGAVLDYEIQPNNLLDFETIVRNSILSFLTRNWDSFGQFKTWVNKSVRLEFNPYE